MKKFWLFVPAMVVLLSAPASANLIVNGSFEADPFTANGNYKLGLVANDVTGWFIPSGDRTYPWGVRNGNPFGASTPFGDQWIVLGRYDTGSQFSIQQTFGGLTSGGTYQLTFSIASELNCCAMAEVSFLSGSSTPAQVFLAPNSGSFWTDWATYTLDFVATGSSATLQFKDLLPTTAGYDLGLDNVQVEATTAVIPEPTTLTLLGLGLVGLRRSLTKRR